MNTFKLKIVASNKVFYDGEAQSLTVPYIDGGSMTFWRTIQMLLCRLKWAK